VKLRQINTRGCASTIPLRRRRRRRRRDKNNRVETGCGGRSARVDLALFPLPPAAVRSKIRWNWTTSTRRAFDVARLGIPGIANSRQRLPVQRCSSASLPGVLKAVPPDKASAFLCDKRNRGDAASRDFHSAQEIRRKVASPFALLEILLHHAREYIYIRA